MKLESLDYDDQLGNNQLPDAPSLVKCSLRPRN
jgi:hypothetical protein